MTSMEIKSQIEERIKILENRLEGIYEKRRVNGLTCFVLENGSWITLDYLLPFGALVIGHADNEDEARLNRFEDGDLFYLEDMDEETMFQAMLNEIEQ